MVHNDKQVRSRAFSGELHLLFYQRTQVCLWLGAIFFALFSFLDYICYPEFFLTFGRCRLLLVALVLFSMLLLRLPQGKRYVRPIMYFLLLLGTFTISFMVLHLGGFLSDYYVGILLMMAGSFSVLPYTVFQTLFTGSSMYVVYVVTVLLGSEQLGVEEIRYGLNNTFFFFSIIGVTAIQSFDDLKSQLGALQAQRNLRSLKEQLLRYTNDLEGLVKTRMEQQEESELRFKDLYNSIDDLIVVIDQDGQIHQHNQSAATLLGPHWDSLEGAFLSSFFKEPHQLTQLADLRIQLEEHGQIGGIQMELVTGDGREVTVEISGTRVFLDGPEPYYQLIIRDISTTKEMEQQVLESNRLVDSSRQDAIFGLAHLAECRDGETGAHLNRIREYTKLLAEVLMEDQKIRASVRENFIQDIYRSAVLHDIGKVGIPDDILLKPGKLSTEEMELMKHHCHLGSKVLKDAQELTGGQSFLSMGQEISHYHHERWDGSGYPEGLAGENIPLAARIVALADVYDALTSSRSYKPAYPHDEARAFIIDNSGKHFDPQVVDAFLKREQEFKQVRKNLLLHG